MDQPKLTKPLFIKIADIRPGQHCYNVYGKVTSAKTTDKSKVSGEKLTFVEGVIADETAAADFRFNADQAGAVKAGAVIAIRNGKSSVVNEHIVLEVDRFGKLSAETVAIDKPNLANNISATSWEKKPPK